VRHELARSPDERWDLTRTKVPEVEGCQKVDLIGNGPRENRNVFGVRLVSHALDERRGGRGDDGNCGVQDQPKWGGCSGQFCQEISFSLVYHVLGGQARQKSQFRQSEQNVARASGGSRSGNKDIGIAKDADLSGSVQIYFTGASEHCRVSFGEGEPSLGGLRLQGPLLVAIVRSWQPAWERLGLSARAGLSHRGQAPSGCPRRRGSTLREVSPEASTFRVDESALWSLA